MPIRTIICRSTAAGRLNGAQLDGCSLRRPRTVEIHRLILRAARPAAAPSIRPASSTRGLPARSGPGGSPWRVFEILDLDGGSVLARRCWRHQRPRTGRPGGFGGGDERLDGGMRHLGRLLELGLGGVDELARHGFGEHIDHGALREVAGIFSLVHAEPAGHVRIAFVASPGWGGGSLAPRLLASAAVSRCWPARHCCPHRRRRYRTVCPAAYSAAPSATGRGQGRTAVAPSINPA